MGRRHHAQPLAPMSPAKGLTTRLVPITISRSASLKSSGTLHLAQQICGRQNPAGRQILGGGGESAAAARCNMQPAARDACCPSACLLPDSSAAAAACTSHTYGMQ